jgi:hypothetical protein
MFFTRIRANALELLEDLKFGPGTFECSRFSVRFLPRKTDSHGKIHENQNPRKHHYLRKKSAKINIRGKNTGKIGPRTRKYILPTFQNKVFIVFVTFNNFKSK